MSRDRISRPTASVPSTNSQLPPSIHTGGARKCSRNCSIGECDAPRSAKTASSTRRSEEHTSELQSLMLISYVAFCLTKQPHNQTMSDQKHSALPLLLHTSPTYFI